MGDCKYCGEPAGFLRSVHKDCKLRCDDAEFRIVALVEEVGIKGGNLVSMEKQVFEEAARGYIDKAGVPKLVVKGWEKAVEIAFDDGVLSEEEESNLAALKDHFSLTQSDLDKKGAFSKTVKGSTLRSILEGNIPERMTVQGDLPFNFQKTEKLIWLFTDVEYIEQKKRTRYVGGSKGVSVRVVKGVYFRTGAFKGERVETHESIHADTGLLGVTNKHIYFTGSVKSFRIRLDKIVSFQPYSDGIGVQRDAATAKPQSFVTGDGWFTYNLITNVAQL